MRHGKKRLQLNRFTSWRRATLVSLAKAVIVHQQIKTTTQKAKAVKPFIDKLISLGKENSLCAKRQAFRILGNHGLVNMLFNDVAMRFANRRSGYTRIFNLGQRRGDNARMAILQLTEIKEKKPKKIKPEAKMPPEITKEQPVRGEKPKTEISVKQKPPITQKPKKKFLGGLRSIFKKERDSL